MGNNRPISTKCWENFLTSLGYKCIRTKGSHDQWVKKGSRTIPVQGNEKQVPAFQLRCSSRTIGCTVQSIYDWVEANC